MPNQRLFKEYKEAMSSAKNDTEVHLSLPDEANIFNWRATIQGPEATPYEAGRFALDIECPPNYPLQPPKVTFLTNVFHPNIAFKSGKKLRNTHPSLTTEMCGTTNSRKIYALAGEICLDILKPDSWTPAWTIASVCRAISVLLSHPEADSPLNCDCGNLIRNGDMRGYRSMARMYTRLYAMEE